MVMVGLVIRDIGKIFSAAEVMAFFVFASGNYRRMNKQHELCKFCITGL